MLAGMTRDETAMVVRIDDNGRTVLVQDDLRPADAETLRGALAARGHKQEYLVLAYRDQAERAGLFARHGILR